MPKKVVPAKPTQAKDLRSYFKAGPSPRPAPSEATTSAPVIGPRVGTRHLPRFDVNKEPSLVRFQAYLQSIEGKMRKPAVARAITTDVSKSLAFFSSDVEASVLWESLLDEVAVHRSVDHLRASGAIEVDGLISKLDRLGIALSFIKAVIKTRPSITRHKGSRMPSDVGREA